MLVEDSPSQLLSQHSLTSFEDVFFKLCSAADDKNKRIIPQKNTGTIYKVGLINALDFKESIDYSSEREVSEPTYCKEILCRLQ